MRYWSCISTWSAAGSLSKGHREAADGRAAIHGDGKHYDGRVKRGGDRQELHEAIRVHSMAAGKVVKEQGGENDLLARIANDPLFGTTLEELKASCIRRILSAAPRSKRRNL